MVTSTVNPSVLDTTLGDLVLRIQGSDYKGQTLRLKSAKCTIGSGPSCTLRLRGRNVEPLHCIILRGPKGAVIRRWSSNTRLNGQTFTNALLSTGDRLSIGPLEFEIVATGEITAEPPAANAFYTDQCQQDPALAQSRKVTNPEAEQFDTLRRQLRQEEESLDLRAKQLEETAAALRAEQNIFETERRRWEDLRNASQLEESQRQAAAEEKHLTQLKAQWAELETQRQNWTLSQQQRQNDQDASQQRLQDRERQCNERAAELDALDIELKTRKLQINAQHSTIEAHKNELADQAADLARQITKNDAGISQLEARNSQLDARAAELQTQSEELNERSVQFEAQAAELKKQSADLQKQSAEFQVQSDDLQAQSDDLQAQSDDLQARKAELDARRAELETQRNQWEESCRTREETLSAWEAKLAERESLVETSPPIMSPSDETTKALSDELQARTKELDSKQAKFENQRSQWEESCQFREKTISAGEAEIIKKVAQLKSIQEQIAVKQEQLDGQLALWKREREQWESERAKRESSGEVVPSTNAPAAQPASQHPAGKAPVEVEDILRRFSHEMEKTEEKEEEEDYTTVLTHVAQPSAEQDIADQPATPIETKVSSEAAAAPSTGQEPAHEEEESVNDYMTRLMERIRSTQGVLNNKADNPYASKSSQAESPSLPFASAPSPAEPSTPAFLPRREMADLPPHTVAPEKNVDITLFRNLANYSAQSALGKHARRQMTLVMYSKLAVALIGGFTGVGLLWVWRTWFTNSITLFSAIMSFGVAIVWGLQYVIMTIRLLTDQSDNPEPRQASHHKDDKQKTPSDHLTISEIAEKEHTTGAESPAETGKNKTTARGKQRL